MDEYVGKGSRCISHIGGTGEGMENAPDHSVDGLGLVVGHRAAVIIEELLPCVDGCIVGFVVDDQQRKFCHKFAAGCGITTVSHMITYPFEQSF